MKILDASAVEQVSGGQLTITVNITVPTADTIAFVGLLNAFLSGEITDSVSFIAHIGNAPTSFNDMEINTITIGSFGA